MQELGVVKLVIGLKQEFSQLFLGSPRNVFHFSMNANCRGTRCKRPNMLPKKLNSPYLHDWITLKVASILPPLLNAIASKSTKSPCTFIA